MTGDTPKKKAGLRLPVLLLIGGVIALPILGLAYKRGVQEYQAKMIYGDSEAKERRLARYADGTETRPNDLRISDFNTDVNEALSRLIGQSASNETKTAIWKYLRPKDDRPPQTIRTKGFRDNDENLNYQLFIENEAVVPRKPTRQVMVRMKPRDTEIQGTIDAIGIRYKCPVKTGDYTWQKDPCDGK
ncbi:hypothetical protein ACJ3XI_04730 [Litorimonas sp. RW-G-Af-16]|uniref:hypothetical protein n=1 Tax=Litorimonas sp. RW-G-Af-16 TaxID=3241168 RepID=UPI00390C438A